MDVLEQLLPGEHIGGFPARFHALGISRHIEESRKRLELESFTLKPQSFFHKNYETLYSLHGTELSKEIMNLHAFGNFLRPFLPSPDSIYLNQNVKKLREVNFKGNFSINNTTWKWCSLCVEKDIDLYGVPIFHRDHQIPAVFHCERHNIGLISRCSTCNFSISELREHYFPPENNRCPYCGNNFSPFDGFFNNVMADIEKAMLNLTQTDCRLKLLDFIQHIQEYADLDLGLKDTVAQKRRIKAWREFITNYLSDDMYITYFRGSTLAESYKAGYNILSNQSLFNSSAGDIPLHPIAYVIALHATKHTIFEQ